MRGVDEEPRHPTFGRLERALDYAYVRDSAVLGTRNAFVRLVPPGTATPANTFSVDHCDVDVDERGDVIGITLVWEESAPPMRLGQVLDSDDDEVIPNEALQRASARARQIVARHSCELQMDMGRILVWVLAAAFVMLVLMAEWAALGSVGC